MIVQMKRQRDITATTSVFSVEIPRLSVISTLDPYAKERSAADVQIT
jgi:hypothetical protein